MSFITSKSAKVFAGVVGFAIALVFVANATNVEAFSTNLTVGSSGADVTTLQNWLISKGFSISAGATGYFGDQTKAALAAFQSANGISPATGYFGSITMAKVNAMGSGSSAMTYPAGCSSSTGFSVTTGTSCMASAMTYPAGCSSAVGFSPTTGMSCVGSAVVSFPAGCSSAVGFSATTGMSCAGGSTPTTPTTAGPLTGGAGTVDQYSLISSLSNEDVGEGNADVKVYGLDIEVGDGSDIALNAVKLVFDEGTAGSNFDDYASEVTVWLDSKKVATMDASKFTDDNNWTSTATLSGAVIKAGKTGKLYVAVTGINNLDTNDAADTWTLDITSVRWTDASGALISEDPATGTRTFTFETSAVAADTEFKISADNSTINDAHVIDIHATDDTQNVSILSFKVKIEGTSDVELKDLPVNLDVTTQDNIDEMISGLTLWMDGAEVASSNLGTDCIEDANCALVGADESYIFHDIDTVLKAGSTYKFLVKADIFGITDTGDVAAGDTISANFGETQTQLTSFDAEDETGTNLVDGDKTGTATGSASTVRDTGIQVVLVGSPTASVAKGLTTAPDIGTYTITFDVTAFGAEMWIDGTKPTLTGADSIDLDIVPGTGGTGTQDAAITTTTDALRTGTVNTTSRFKVAEGETERFTITSVVTPTVAGGLYSVSLTSLAYDDADINLVDATNLEYTTNLTGFVTPSANLVLAN